MSSEPQPGALPTGTRTALDNPALRGIGLMFVGTFFVAAMIGSIRHVSATLHPFEIALFRNLFALVVVLPWFYRYGIAPLRTQRFGLHVLRALFNIVAMLAFSMPSASPPCPRSRRWASRRRSSRPCWRRWCWARS